MFRNWRRDCRVRSGETNDPRPIDIDLLFFGKKSISSDYLTIPHPRAVKRRFVLEPLAEIAPDLILPGQEFSVVELLSRLPNNGVGTKIPTDLIIEAKS